ncbi:hypothetical protein [Pontiella sp.]|uniref:hypothetical protein n=1 Tax=Pontiella sp. TaxID=2837462 RepID=UPI003564A851
MRLNLWRGYGNFYGSADLFASSPAPETYHRVESPNGKIWKEAGGSYDGSFTNLGFSGLLNECTNGLWTLTLNAGAASEQIYKFSVDISGVTSNRFGDITLLHPLFGATADTNPPNIQWSSTSLLPEIYLQINENNFPYTYGEDTTLPGSATNWIPSAPLTTAEQSLLMYYQSANDAGIAISTPTNVIGGAAAPGWSASGNLRSYTYSEFNLPGGGGNAALGEAVDAPELAWTTGGDDDWFAQDYEYVAGTNAASSDLTAFSFAESWIETTVQGPGYLDFSWAIYADVEDSLIVTVDDNFEDAISGGREWAGNSVYIADTGPVAVRWTFYHYDVFGDLSEAFLDGVVYYPEPPDYSAELRLWLQRNNRNGNLYYLALPQLLYAYPDATTVHEIESPNGLFSGGEGTSSSTHMPTLDALLNECTNGMWTLYFNRNSPYEEQYTFSMEAVSVSTNDFPPVEILNPPAGATGVSTDPTYQWTGPGTFEQLFVSVRDDEAQTTVGSASLPPISNAWTSATLAGGTNTFTVSYSSYNFAGLDISEPSGGYPLSYWNATVQIGTVADSTFVTASGFVPLPVALLPPMITGEDFGLSFVSQSGATHWVEYTTNLVTGPWMPATNFPGDGATTWSPCPPPTRRPSSA